MIRSSGNASNSESETTARLETAADEVLVFAVRRKTKAVPAARARVSAKHLKAVEQKEAGWGVLFVFILESFRLPSS